MTRKYELKKRAERREATRRRIVEAAIELHGTVGPARTTVSDVARLAGVQRHTYYNHFPDEHSLLLACSGLHAELNPMPDPETWLEIADAEQRLRCALAEIYAYYERNESMVENVVRDAEVHRPTRDVIAIRRAPRLARMREVLAAPFRARGRRRARIEAAVDLALDFRSWQLLVRRRGLSTEDAIEVAVTAVRCQ